MNKTALQKLLSNLYNHKITLKEAVEKLSTLPYEILDFAKIDPLGNIRCHIASLSLLPALAGGFPRFRALSIP